VAALLFCCSSYPSMSEAAPPKQQGRTWPPEYVTHIRNVDNYVPPEFTPEMLDLQAINNELEAAHMIDCLQNYVALQPTKQPPSTDSELQNLQIYEYIKCAKASHRDYLGSMCHFSFQRLAACHQEHGASSTQCEPLLKDIIRCKYSPLNVPLKRALEARMPEAAQRLFIPHAPTFGGNPPTKPTFIKEDD